MTPASIQDQAARYRRYAGRALDYSMARQIQHRDHLIALGERRLIDIGYKDYGDRSWHLPDEKVDEEHDQEIADAIFYASIKVRRWIERGGVPLG